ncbi:unnamed protein product [Calypogeia fissa]
MDFLDWRLVVLAIFTTCAALVAIVVLNRQKKLRRLPSTIAANAAQVFMLNSSVYELYNPSSTPSMEVVFFHGFQHGDYEDAHISTWKCGDGSSIWPQTWLAEKFCDARILTISYNDSLVKSCQGGIFDMYLLGENLVSDLLGANIGQQRCPVVLVGHSFGGLVVKQVCAHAASKTGGLKGNSESSFKLTAFLENIKGIFFYSTPHHGIKDIRAAEHFVAKGPLLDCVKTLSTQTARLNSDFDILWGQEGKYKTWQIAGLCESIPTKWGRSHDLVFVQEASSRYGASFNVVEGADHISVCRPAGKTSRSFSALANFLERVAPDLKATVHGLPNYPSTLEKRAFAIQQKLGVGPVLGIVGMGGIGKTTLAKQLFNTLSQQFEYTCFVDNVKDIKIHKLNDWVLNRFLRNGTSPEQNSLKWSHLQKKKVLITMDDVNSELQIKILPTLNELGNGSLLIFTTRDQGVLDTFPNCVIYEVEFLNFEEARKLFCQHAFEQEEIPESLVKMNQQLKGTVKNVIQKCNGLPLTLEVTGSYLRKHKTDATAWKQTLDKLGKAQAVTGLRDDRVWASLRISYDALSDEEKEMFIEAGTCFCGQPLEVALAAWSTAYEYPESCWANLLRTSMVKEISKTHYYRSNPNVDGAYKVAMKYKEVWVHEHLCDLAKKESKGAKGPVNLFNANVVEADTTIVRLWDEEGCAELPLESLDKLENLKYLELYGIWPQGSSNNLSRKLCMLYWSVIETRVSEMDQHRPTSQPVPGRHAPPFTINLEGMNDLAVLGLKWWEISQDTLKTLEKLSNLRILSLCSKSKGPERLPDNFGHLPHLKQLVLESFNMAALPQSFGNLSTLVYLRMSSVTVVELPESFGNLSSLETFVFENCEDLASLPESFGNLSSLAILVFAGCDKLASLPESFGNLSSLATLVFSGCDKFECLPESFGKLPCLTTLVFEKCTSLASLPESFGCLSSLVLLRIRDCPSLETPDLSTDLRRFERRENLRSLTSVHLSRCGSLQRLPACFGVLPSLEILELFCCEKLRLLPETFGECKALKKLTIGGAQNLELLPDSLGNLTALTVLELRECGNLKRLPAFSNLSALQELELKDCHLLERLPDNFGRLRALQKLTINGADRLVALSDDFGNLPALTYLCLVRVRLKRLPASFGNLAALQELQLRRCHQLQRLPDNFGLLRALQKLTIKGANKLVALSDDFGNLPSLTDLSLRSCSRLERLPETFGNLSALQVLHFESCITLQRFPDNFGEVSPLFFVVYRPETDKLEALLDSFGNLSSLKELYLMAKVLQRFPKSIGQQLHALRRLHVNAPTMSSVPEELGNLSSLEVLTFDECRSMQTLPDSLGRSSSLRTLILKNCSSLRSLPDSLGDHFVSRSHGDGSSGTDTRRPLGKQSSEGGASMERFRLYVVGCPFLDDSVMQGLGWLEFDVGNEFKVRDTCGYYIDLREGKWYHRKRHSPVIPS